jgi:hypothetical protein
MVRLRAAGEQLDVGTNKGQWRKVYGMERGTQAAGVRRPQALVSQWTVWHHLSAPSAPSSTDLQPTPYEGHNRSPTSGNGYYVASRELGGVRCLGVVSAEWKGRLASVGRASAGFSKGSGRLVVAGRWRREFVFDVLL